MKTIIRQIALAILSFWGLLFIPFAMTIRLTTDASHPFLHSTSQFLAVVTNLLWFVPGVWISYLFGAQKALYGVDIIVEVLHPIGWLLPAVFWYIAGNIILWIFRMIRKMKSQQGGPGYPPQGVGSPDP